METISNYEQQAIDFLKETGAEIEITFKKSGKHFDTDKEDRDIYSVYIKRGNRGMSFDFGQSFNNSGQYQVVEHLRNKLWCKQTTGGKIFFNEKEYKALGLVNNKEKDIPKNPNYSIPTAYDILTCLTKYDPGTFENFCSEFGYDEDSKKADKIYLAVKNEYKDLCSLFTDKEIQQLSEIQ